MEQQQMVDWLQGIYNKSNGPGSIPGKIERVQLWDLYSTKPMYLTADLAGLGATLFDVKVSETVLPIGGVAGTSPLYSIADADTNLDSPGNTPFDMFVHGMSLDYLNRQQSPGTVGSANDLAFWHQSKQAMLSDTAATLKINDLDVDRLTFDQAPAGAGFHGSASQGTTAALTIGASMNTLSNGMPLAGNYRSYANEGPFFCKKNSTIKFNAKFGNSFITANMVYKPVNSGIPFVFMRCVLRGFRIWWAQ